MKEEPGPLTTAPTCPLSPFNPHFTNQELLEGFATYLSPQNDNHLEGVTRKRKRPLSEASLERLYPDLYRSHNKFYVKAKSLRATSSPNKKLRNPESTYHAQVTRQQSPVSLSPCTSQTSIASLSYGPTLPLTKENLKSLDSTNGDMPSTPSKKTVSSLDNLKPKDVSEIRCLLQHNCLRIYDSRAYAAYPAVAGAVEDILGRERGSAMKPEVQAALAQTLMTLKMSHETTFLVNFMTEVLAGGRQVPEVSMVPTQEQMTWITREWREEHLRIGWLAPLRKNSIPKLETKNKALKALLKKFPKVCNPVPDMIFGFFPEAFEGVEKTINDAYFMYSKVTEESLHSFCILEAKSDRGEAEDAVNQACRGGAALVQSRMMFNNKAKASQKTTASAYAKAGLLNSDNTAGADLASIAFSIVLTPRLAEIYVHWAEHRVNNATIYHMNLVDVLAISKPSGAGIKDFRSALCSILDWGLRKRKREIQAVIASIVNNIGADGTLIVAEEMDEEDSDSDDDDEAEDGDGALPTKKRARNAGS